jgi:hypothetical protein
MEFVNGVRHIPKIKNYIWLLVAGRETWFCARDGHYKTEKLSDKTKGTYDQLCLGIPFSNLWLII